MVAHNASFDMSFIEENWVEDRGWEENLLVWIP